MAKITLDNGVVFVGTVEEVKEFLNGRTDDRGKIERKFKVGDYVKIVNEDMMPYTLKYPVTNFQHIFSEGSIVKIKEVDESDDSSPYFVVSLDGNDGTWCGKEDIKLVTEDEKEQAKWSELGRKPGEYKEGDIVRVVNVGDSLLNVDAIGEVVKIGDSESFRVYVSHTNVGDWISPEDVELIVPVEQRFDLR